MAPGPKIALTPLELDGYLTGIIVAPQYAPLLPSQWLPGLWGAQEPIFENTGQIQAVLGVVMERYNALIADIDRGLTRLEADRVCDYRPMFLTGGGKPAHDDVRSWARGFWKAMQLAPEAWRSIAEGERSRNLIAPLIGFFEVEGQVPFALRDDIDAALDEEAAAIPQTILVLRKLTQIRHQSAPPRQSPTRQNKPGRNDPCPCGSGRKYKRCCGSN
jgi:uncharacterized protein